MNTTSLPVRGLLVALAVLAGVGVWGNGGASRGPTAAFDAALDALPAPRLACGCGAEPPRTMATDAKALEPADVPAKSRDAHKRAMELLKELEKIDAGVRAEAEEIVKKRPAAITPAAAWDQYAVAMLLHGDSQIASWAGLNALRLEWTGHYLTNAGVSLVHLGKTELALELLGCAKELGHRSPYLFEALSTAYRKQGDAAKAKEAIETALKLAPADPLIEAEATIIRTGRPPSLPGDDRGDELDRFLRELEDHHNRSVAAMKQFSDTLLRVTKNPESHRARANYLEKLHPEHPMVEAARKAVAEAKAKKTDAWHDHALTQCVLAYLKLSHDLISFHLGESDFNLLFWAEVVDADADSFATEQRQTWGELGPRDRATLDSLAHGSRARYHEREAAAWKLRAEQLKAASDKAARQAAEEAYCKTVRELFATWVRETQFRSDLAAHNFGNVASRLARWGEVEALDARDYALRGGRARRDKSEAGAKGYGIGVGVSFRLLHELVTDVKRHGSIPSFLDRQAKWFADKRDERLTEIDGVKRNIDFVCTPVEARALERLRREAYDAYLAMLLDRLKSDFEASYDGTIHCEFKIGRFGIKIDDKLKVSGNIKIRNWTFSNDGASVSAGPLNAEVKIAEGGEPAVSIGGGASGSVAPGVVGSGDLTLFIEKNKRTGKIDGGLAFSGKLGLGVGGKKASVACYPGQVSLKFYARAAYDDAVAYMKARAERKP